MPRLLAMAPFGDVLVSELDGERRVHMSMGVGGTRPVSIDESERIISFASLTLVERDFETWGDLDDWVRARVAEIPDRTIDVSEWGATDVEDMLQAADDFVDDGEPQEAMSVLLWLLGLDLVRDDPSLHGRVLEAFGTLRAPTTVPTIATDVPPAQLQAARHNFEQLIAA